MTRPWEGARNPTLAPFPAVPGENEGQIPAVELPVSNFAANSLQIAAPLALV